MSTRPIAETSQRMPQLTTSLLQKYGDQWTHSLAINDLYFDFMGPSLAAAGKGGTDAPINVAAGDGSESAYQRIRAGQFQKVTVAEPLNLQGWQLVDELNRAFAGEQWSGYLSPAPCRHRRQCRVRWRPQEHLRSGKRLSRRVQETLGQDVAASLPGSWAPRMVPIFLRVASQAMLTEG